MQAGIRLWDIHNSTNHAIIDVYKRQAQEAARYLDEQIDGRTVGIGGSVTMDQIGIYPMLEKHNTVYWHLRMPQGMTDAEVRAKENAAEIYLLSLIHICRRSGWAIWRLRKH